MGASRGALLERVKGVGRLNALAYRLYPMPGLPSGFRLEAQNPVCHAVFATPDTSVDDQSFGTISYTSSQPPAGALGAKGEFWFRGVGLRIEFWAHR